MRKFPFYCGWVTWQTDLEIMSLFKKPLLWYVVLSAVHCCFSSLSHLVATSHTCKAKNGKQMHRGLLFALSGISVIVLSIHFSSWISYENWRKFYTKIENRNFRRAREGWFCVLRGSFGHRRLYLSCAGSKHAILCTNSCNSSKRSALLEKSDKTSLVLKDFYNLCAYMLNKITNKNIQILLAIEWVFNDWWVTVKRKNWIWIFKK